MDNVIKWVETPSCKACKYRDEKSKRCKLEYKCPYGKKKGGSV